MRNRWLQLNYENIPTPHNKYYFRSCNSQTNPTNRGSIKGRLEDNVYLNDFFRFRLKVDTPWLIVNQAELTQLLNERLDMIDETGETTPPISQKLLTYYYR